MISFFSPVLQITSGSMSHNATVLVTISVSRHIQWPLFRLVRCRCSAVLLFLEEYNAPMGNPARQMSDSSGQYSMVVGITHCQTCMVLAPRLRILRAAGLRVTLISAPGELLESTAAAVGVERIAIPMKRGIAPWADVKSLWRLWRMLSRIRPSLVEFGTPKAGLLGTVAAALCGVPRRVYALRGLRLETQQGWKLRLLLWTERAACASAHVVLCNSESLRNRALALRLAPAHKLRVLGDGSSNGVDMERFAQGPDTLRQQLGWGGETFVIGFVGRLTRDKGVPELLAAFEMILRAQPEARLLLVGWFDTSEDAVSAADRARIASHPHIRCTGMVEDTAPWYRAMDVMVLPTWREGFPNVVLEAQSSALPVITTLSTGSRDSVIPEVTGLLIPPGYPEAIAEAVLKLRHDPALRRQMGDAARAWVREHYVEGRVLNLTAQFYLSLLRDAEQEPRAAAPEHAEPAAACD